VEDTKLVERLEGCRKIRRMREDIKGVERHEGYRRI